MAVPTLTLRLLCKTVKGQTASTHLLKRIPVLHSSQRDYLLCPSSQCRSTEGLCTSDNRLYPDHLSQQKRLVDSRLSRQFSTTVESQQKNGVFSRLWAGFGFTGKMKSTKSELRRAAMRSYMCCTDLINHIEFFEDLDMSDTFNSWFRITELHTWLVMSKLAKQGKEGHFMRNALVEYMWIDVESRAKRLGKLAGVSTRKEGIKTFSEQFYCSIYNYDEGLLSNDQVLAGAIWRSFFETECDDPVKVEKMVEYIRKQVHHLDGQDGAAMVHTGLLTFLPLHGDTEDVDHAKQVMRTICMKS